jgi:manganese transport protein
LPAAIIPMLIITSKKHFMGDFVNKPWVKTSGILISSMIILINAVLLYLTFSGTV